MAGMPAESIAQGLDYFQVGSPKLTLPMQEEKAKYFICNVKIKSKRLGFAEFKPCGMSQQHGTSFDQGTTGRCNQCLMADNLQQQIYPK